MNAVKLDIGWTEDQKAVVSLSRAKGTRRLLKRIDISWLHRAIAAPRQENLCPECRSIIYSRKSKLCGVCGEPLPSSLLFSPEEEQRIKRLLETERQRHKQWMNRA